MNTLLQKIEEQEQSGYEPKTILENVKNNLRFGERMTTNTQERIEAAVEELASKAVTNFLGWKLPEDFDPDGGISFSKIHCDPVGTHLLTAQQAKEMMLAILDKDVLTTLTQTIGEDAAKEEQDRIVQLAKKHQASAAVCRNIRVVPLNMFLEAVTNTDAAAKIRGNK